MFLHNLNVVLAHRWNRGKPMRASLHWLKWQVFRRTAPGPIVYQWTPEVRFLVRRNEDSMLGNIYSGLAEPDAMTFALHAVDEGDLFIDVGANVGAYTLLCCGVRRARGLCFEPVPATYARLIDNLNLNGLVGRVTAHNLGVSDPPSRVLRFTQGGDSVNHVAVAGDAADDVVEVRTEALDQLVLPDGPVLLKVDVEGFELPVLKGARTLLESGRVYAAIVEINEYQDRYGHSGQEALAFMRHAGFRPCRYDGVTRRLTPLDGHDASADSTVFVRDLAEVEARLRRAPRLEVGGVRI